MRMKNTVLALLAVVGLVTVMSSCNEEYTTNSGPEYVMFADTLSENLVFVDGESFPVTIAATVATDYDRTFGVEVVDKGSNAIEGLHYRLESNTVTIPAGELVGEVRVKGNYEAFEPTDSVGFKLRLVMPEQLNWDLYAGWNETKVVMYKGCPFELDNFTGWCVLTSQ